MKRLKLFEEYSTDTLQEAQDFLVDLTSEVKFLIRLTQKVIYL